VNKQFDLEEIMSQPNFDLEQRPKSPKRSRSPSPTRLNRFDGKEVSAKNLKTKRKAKRSLSPPRARTTGGDPSFNIYPHYEKKTIDQHKKYTKTQIMAFLKDHVPVPKNEWSTLKSGTIIKYIRTDGRFVIGGFFKYYYAKNDKAFLCYENIPGGNKKRSKKYKSFSLSLEHLSRLYRRLSKPDIQIMQLDRQLNEAKSHIYTLANLNADLETKNEEQSAQLDVLIAQIKKYKGL
jgi:hypothetical protein